MDISTTRHTRREATTTTEPPSGLEFPVAFEASLDRTLEMGVHFRITAAFDEQSAGEAEEMLDDFLAGIGFDEIEGDIVGRRAHYIVSNPRQAEDVFGTPLVVLTVLVDGDTCWGGSVPGASPIVEDASATWACFDPGASDELQVALFGWEIGQFAEGVPLISALRSAQYTESVNAFLPGRVTFELPLGDIGTRPDLGRYAEPLSPLFAMADAMATLPVSASAMFRDDGRIEKLDLELDIALFGVWLDNYGRDLGVSPDEIAQRPDFGGTAVITVTFSEHHARTEEIEARIDRAAEGKRTRIDDGLEMIGNIMLDAIFDPEG